MIHIYCGDGKGKTTASIGLAVRAAGTGRTVYVARFLKSKASGEVNALALIPNIVLGPSPDQIKFVFKMTEDEKVDYRAFAAKLLDDAFASGADLLVLDECIGAVNAGMLDLEKVLRHLRSHKENQEIVLTGRDPDPALVEMADYITQMKKIRHPFDTGHPAREGVEF